MTAFITRRTLQASGVLVVVSFIGFLLFTFTGDPVASILGLDATPADRDALRGRLGLDDPFILRYLTYALNAAQGEFGISYATARPVEEVIVERLPATIELAAVAVLFSLAIGIPLGVYTALNRDRWLARFVMTVSIVGVSLPTFVVGILLIFLFAVGLGWLPSFGRGEVVKLGWWSTGLLTVSGLKALIMPALSLAIAQSALVARLVRAEMIEVLRADFIKFARARGLRNRAVHFHHALRNTMIPIVTVTGIQLGFLFAFSIVAEAVFQWPGMGLLFLQSLGKTDVPVMSAFLILVAFFFVIINLAVDLLYMVIDPRLRIRHEIAEGVAGS